MKNYQKYFSIAFAEQQRSVYLAAEASFVFNLFLILSKNEPRVLKKLLLQKMCIAIFANWHYSIFLYQSKQQMVLNAIRFILISLKANLAMIFISFVQKCALVKTFQPFAVKFLNQKGFLVREKSASKFSSSWRGICDVFYSSYISQSIQAT